MPFLFLTHRTNFCPVPEMKIGGIYFNHITGESQPSNDLYRSTLHWSFADLKPNVVLLKSPHLNPFGSNGPKYIVIEPVETVLEFMVGGWFSDLFMVGPHTPSEGSILIAPIEEISALEEQSFKGKIIPYDPALETSEKIFLAFTSDRLENFQLQIRLQETTSNLERIKKELNFSEEECQLIKNANKALINLNVYTEKEGEYDICFQKKELGYIISTDRLHLDFIGGLTLLSPPILPSETLLYYTESKVSISLEELFPNMPWMMCDHSATPFSKLERAIISLDPEIIKKVLLILETVNRSDSYEELQEYVSALVKENLVEIITKLNKSSGSYKKFLEYRRALNQKYNLQLTEVSEVSRVNSYCFFSKQQANLPMLPTRSPTWIPTITHFHP